MAAIISTPVNVITPVMLNNCVNICITDDEVGTGSCTNASIQITVFLVSNNLDGDSFTFLGYIFTIDNTLAAPTGSSMPWNQATTQLKATALKTMLSQHPAFNGLVDFSTVTGGVFTITWRNCGFIENFLPDFSGLSYAPSIIGTNGTDLTYREGFQFIYQLYEIVGGDEVPLCEILPLSPIINGQEGINCFDLKSKLPPFNAGFPIKTFTENIILNFTRQFKVKYGTVFNAYQCGVEFGAYIDSLTFKVVASLEQPTTWDGMTPYVFNSSTEIDDDKKILFLTNRPKSSYTCLLIPEVINVYLNLDEIYGLAPGTTDYQLFVLPIIDGVPNPDDTLVSTWNGDGVYQIPISPTELGLTPSGNRYEYLVYIRAFNATLGTVIITEQRLFIYGKDCNTCKTAIYFLDDLYCWGALRYTDLEANDYQADAELIETELACVGSDRDYALPVYTGGKNLYMVNAGDVFSYQTDGLDKKESDKEWLRMFRRSPVHMIRYESYPLSYGFRKVIVLPNTIRIKEKGGQVRAEFQLTYNNEDKVHEYTL